MLLEISQAARFWAQQLATSSSLDASLVALFERELSSTLQERYVGHWYEENPIKGQAYRSILADYDNGLIDEVLVAAAARVNILDLASRLPHQSGVRMWVDPGEVTVEPIRGRGHEVVLFQHHQQQHHRRAASAPRSAGVKSMSSAGSLSANAAPFRSRKSPPLGPSRGGLYTAADHERLTREQSLPPPNAQAYFPPAAAAAPTVPYYDPPVAAASAVASDEHHLYHAVDHTTSFAYRQPPSNGVGYGEWGSYHQHHPHYASGLYVPQPHHHHHHHSQKAF